MMYHRVVFALVFAAAALAGWTDAHGQPKLNFRRLVDKWPTVEVYFSVSCNGLPANPVDKSFYRLKENDLEINNFTLWCPDPRQRCAVSAALVIDVGGGMAGENQAAAKTGALEFIESMDDAVDETAILFVNDSVQLKLGLTTDKTTLMDAVLSLPAGGARALLDGIFEGVNQVAVNGGNPSRAVIAITAGSDSGSLHTTADILTLAKENGVRVFIIGVGNPPPAQFQSIALLTGGKYYFSVHLTHIVAAIREISTLAFSGFQECLITYQASCPDGTLRTVDLVLSNFCSGSDTKSRSYRALKDSSAFIDLGIGIGEAIGYPGREVSLPLALDQTQTPATTMKNAAFSFTFDPAELVFNKISAPPGTILENVLYSITNWIGRIEVQTLSKAYVDGASILCFLHFTPMIVADTTVSAIGFASWDSYGRCFNPVLSDGRIMILDYDRPHIYPGGNIKICQGDSLELVALDGFTDYIWNTGATGRTLTVDKAGIYWVSAMGAHGRDTADAVSVMIFHNPVPIITPNRDTTLCNGQGILIRTTSVYAEYEWSNGSSERNIFVDSPGSYFVRVRDANGCWGSSSAMNVAIAAPPQPEITGKTNICKEDTLQQYAVADGPEFDYHWSVTGGFIAGPANGNTVIVDWSDGAEHSVTVTQTDTRTGCTSAATAQIKETRITASLSVRDDAVICSGSGIRISVPGGYDSYLWSNGDTTSSIYVEAEGDYYATIVEGNCRATTDTVHVSVIDEIPTAITGDRVVCQQDILPYQATVWPGTTYAWRVEGGTIVIGHGTSKAQIQWEVPGEGRVIVEAALGNCFSADTLNILIETTSKPQIVASASKICEGESAILSAPEGYSFYLWSTGETTREIEVTKPGDYTVTVRTANNCPALSLPQHIDVVPAPEKPGITQSGLTLMCSTQGKSYMWWLDGTLIANETSRTLIMTASGNYAVAVVDENGCTASSEPYAFTGLGRYAPGLAKTFTVAPNPGRGEFEVALAFERPEAFTLRIVNVNGQEVSTLRIDQPVESFTRTIRLSDAPPGVYMIMLTSGGVFDYRKIIVQPR